jgi:hypothetical protein
VLTEQEGLHNLCVISLSAAQIATLE